MGSQKKKASIEQVKAHVQSLPLTSGVYLMKDKHGEVIYVGKAVSLRKRVQSYFRSKVDRLKTKLLVENIEDIDYIDTYSEAEALILEASLIKKYMPKFNMMLKDGRTYPYIQITNEKYPRISVVRLTGGDVQKERKKGAEYYGPYVQVTLIREALQLIRRIFPFRMYKGYADKSTLDYDIGLREAAHMDDVDPKEYARNIRRVKMILDGKKQDLYRALTRQMEKHAINKEFEQAAVVRDQIRAMSALYSGTSQVNAFKEAEQLMRLLHLPKRPDRIECFDISHVMGNHTVGSMVSFLNGQPDKSHYRRFKIKDVKGIDDFSSIAEVVRRRYTRLKKESKSMPDLIVIDGGKGQLSAACAELKALDIEVPIISLAKREEEVFVPQKRQPVILPRESLALKLLQRTRDEAHRFAVAYHRLLRGKAAWG